MKLHEIGRALLVLACAVQRTHQSLQTCKDANKTHFCLTFCLQLCGCNFDLRNLMMKSSAANVCDHMFWGADCKKFFQDEDVSGWMRTNVIFDAQCENCDDGQHSTGA